MNLWSRETMPNSLVFLLILAIALLPSTTRAAFPEVAQLPSHPELPDPLVMFNGERVATKDQWSRQRRPELKALFQHYMYGYLPPVPDTVDWQVVHEDRQAFGGKATLREVEIAFGPPEVPRI